MSSGATTTCDGCGGLFVDLDAPGHAYVPSSAGCWNAFVQMQADEMQRFRNPPARGLVVDAYMAQHPGDGTDRRDRQSVFIHLIGLCAGLEDGTPHHQLRHLFRRVLDRHPDFPALTR
ncbi:MAG: hypothetical protein JO372_25420, partial [Solirubrobacterales bacterium]|nr:hypothetical protein [Solirubrobacterales bacterium]